MTKSRYLFFVIFILILIFNSSCSKSRKLEKNNLYITDRINNAVKIFNHDLNKFEKKIKLKFPEPVDSVKLNNDVIVFSATLNVDTISPPSFALQSLKNNLTVELDNGDYLLDSNSKRFLYLVDGNKLFVYDKFFKKIKVVNFIAYSHENIDSISTVKDKGKNYIVFTSSRGEVTLAGERGQAIHTSKVNAICGKASMANGRFMNIVAEAGSTCRG